ncbi:MAG: type II toxin-antitoxin system RatA family toxin [Rhodospirillaceae bacterium]|nr:type II toxin-antitoxin system RatA family toxin [Rhodospirillaceae bacterium]
MIVHRETRLFRYPPAQVFDIVADVQRYPEFLPWCVGARVFHRDRDTFDAEVLVGFKMIRERYTSRVTLARPDTIEVTYTSGPFRHLTNTWRFSPAPEGCTVDFYIEFEFRSALLQRLIGSLFHEAVRKMVAAFESRARQLYGEPAGAVAHGRPA